MKAMIYLALLITGALMVSGDISLCPPIPSNLNCFSRSDIVFRVEGVLEISRTTLGCKCRCSNKVVQLICGAMGEWIYENNIMCNGTTVQSKDNPNLAGITQHPKPTNSDNLTSIKSQWNNLSSNKVLMVGILSTLNILILVVAIVVTAVLCVRRRNVSSTLNYMPNLQSQVAYKRRFFTNKNEKKSAERCAIISGDIV